MKYNIKCHILNQTLKKINAFQSKSKVIKLSYIQQTTFQKIKIAIMLLYRQIINFLTYLANTKCYRKYQLSIIQMFRAINFQLFQTIKSLIYNLYQRILIISSKFQIQFKSNNNNSFIDQKFKAKITFPCQMKIF
ncbi:hypothetical protein TTHERM_000150046 (macronuclear) [Tetrahymena thermophila SB210]|uniref:Uncharacterized protein n=1 Tax=Tetrahymena thermophila (strain SB210) TaxID=312017 RepID=W7X9F9_TETTS|nr:hypothetical protein TTHERM_000150046 [Tetrahymena thermophila SB210]EWS73033.1 hypothetical protein TTHERM_000150046 [Tetrahymena thermophila SB210]|eukprot:XP_012654430.1 hypothetical protein TTHERM_000150046 [Tetrahymena thermophila SB210]